jgi:hypothetical protein
VLGNRAAHAQQLDIPADQGELVFRVCDKSIDAHHRVQSGLADNADMMDEIRKTFLDQGKILPPVLFRQRQTGRRRRTAPVHLQSADGCCEHGHVGLQAAEATFDVPELLETYVRPEPTLRNVVVEQLQSHPVTDYRRLTDGDVGKWPCVDHARLIFGRAAQSRIDRVAHPGAHRACDFQVTRRDRPPLPVEGEGDL